MDDKSREMITECFVRALYMDIIGYPREAEKLIRTAVILFEVASPPDERFNRAVDKVQRLT